MAYTNVIEIGENSFYRVSKHREFVKLEMFVNGEQVHVATHSFTRKQAKAIGAQLIERADIQYRMA
ncbi:hypothetical protein [Mycobacterium sp. SA01]|uniref:hypothetical protein n=1 Tax=Mycobacterium sp. SA01 TaxID=3238820 RepID=UPI00351B2B5F